MGEILNDKSLLYLAFEAVILHYAHAELPSSVGSCPFSYDSDGIGVYLYIPYIL